MILVFVLKKPMPENKVYVKITHIFLIFFKYRMKQSTIDEHLLLIYSFLDNVSYIHIT